MGAEERLEGLEDMSHESMGFELQPGERQYVKNKRTETLNRKNSLLLSAAIASSIAGETTSPARQSMVALGCTWGSGTRVLGAEDIRRSSWRIVQIGSWPRRATGGP